MADAEARVVTVTAAGWLWWALLSGATGYAAIRRPRKGRAREVPGGVRVRLIRPCAGASPGLEERLAVVPRVPGGVELEVVLGVAGDEDPAWPAVRGAARRLNLAGVWTRARVLGDRAPNRKVGQLAAAVDLPGPRVDVVINLDSDVDPASVDLSSLLAPLFGEEAVALAWLPPVEASPVTLADRVSGAFLSASLHAFPLLAGLDPNGVTGKAFAIRTEALRAIGGFPAVSDVLGEDMALGAALRRQGLTARMVPVACHSMVGGRSASQVVGRYARWLTVIRKQRPALLWGYPLMFAACTPLMALGAVTGGVAGMSLLGAAVMLRVVTAALARRACGPGAGRAHPLAPGVFLTDALVWAALLRSLGSSTVEWRGRRLRVGRGGALVAVSADATL